jgi:hypothetical protein
MSKLCPKCGKELWYEARACEQCGLPMQGSIKDRLKWLRDDEARARHTREEAARSRTREAAHQQEELIKSLEKSGAPARMRSVAHTICDEFLHSHDPEAYVHEAHNAEGIYLDLVWSQWQGKDSDWGFGAQTRGGCQLRIHLAPDRIVEISAGRGKRVARVSWLEEHWQEMVTEEILSCLAGQNACDWNEVIKAEQHDEAPEKWEYATLIWDGMATGYTRMVSFTHQPPWPNLEPNDFNKTLWRMGEEGWELVNATGGQGESFVNQARALFFKRRLAPETQPAAA